MKSSGASAERESESKPICKHAYNTSDIASELERLLLGMIAKHDNEFLPANFTSCSLSACLPASPATGFPCLGLVYRARAGTINKIDMAK